MTSLLGIRIVFDPSWFIIFALITVSLATGYFPSEYPRRGMGAYWLAAMPAAIPFFVSILLHELAHSLTAMAAGIAMPEIRLFIFGGVSRISHEARSPMGEFKIAFAGSLMRFVPAPGFYLPRLLAVVGLKRRMGAEIE